VLTKIRVLLCVAVLMTGLSTKAQQVNTYGDWKKDFSIQGLQIANTSNSSGATTGVLCNLKNNSCDAYLALNVSCENEHVYPMMINSAVGAFPLTVKCMYFGDLQLYIANEFSSMIEAFESGGEIGFAMPMQGGQYRVVRFSTVGATAAIKEVRTPPKSEQKKGVKSDEIL
jgi:hypothetical protein